MTRDEFWESVADIDQFHDDVFDPYLQVSDSGPSGITTFIAEAWSADDGMRIAGECKSTEGEAIQSLCDVIKEEYNA